MCGIVGIVYKEKARMVEKRLLIGMRDLLLHRGPDDGGLYIKGHVGLGHRRLSIIDISSGHQPMTNEDGSVWIVFNGEIYNFKSIRESLLKDGHIFKTKSDTEVILHLYEQKGINCVSDLNGIFAFAIWDEKNQSLFLARDHMGVKPLYYVDTNEAFIFSSEIKSIIKSGYLKPRCRDDSVFEYFMFRHISGENTLFENVKNLLPANSLILKNNSIKINQFWSAFPGHIENRLSFESAAEKLSYLIQDAVKLQLVSDVPLGTLCSGGLDSSLITAFAARFTEKPINTFSVGFYEDEYDETQYARLVSNQYKTNHHEIRLSNQEFADLLPEMIWYNDEPLNFANSVQIYAISKLAKQFVTVVLTGEGADELFMGYPRYLIPKLSTYYSKLPGFIKSFARIYSRYFGEHRIGKLNRYAFYNLDEKLLYNSSFLDRNFLSEVISNGFLQDLSYRESCIREGKEKNLDSAINLSHLDQKNYLVSILNRQDKMSMAASIESRVPFLDYRIIEFSNTLPIHYKIKLFKTKYILKKIGEKFLSKKVIYRKKSGFGVPLKNWLNDSIGLGRYDADLCSDTILSCYINKKNMEKVLKEHRAGHQDHSEFLWTAINFMIWSKNLVPLKVG